MDEVKVVVWETDPSASVLLDEVDVGGNFGLWFNGDQVGDLWARTLVSSVPRGWVRLAVQST